MFGMIVSASECRKEWNGLFVHKSVWSPRHPQDLVTVVPERARPANPRPEGEPQFLEVEDLSNISYYPESDSGDSPQSDDGDTPVA